MRTDTDHAVADFGPEVWTVDSQGAKGGVPGAGSADAGRPLH